MRLKNVCAFFTLRNHFAMSSAISNTPPFVGVRIPDGMRKKVQKRLKAQGYRTISEYIRDLIRRDVDVDLEKQK